VFGVLADWKKDTEWDGKLEYNDLLVSAQLILLNE